MPAESRGHTWILLRGLSREKGHWGPFLEKFAASYPEDEILPIDLPGTGEYLSVQSPRSIEGIFHFVRAKAIERARHQSQFKILAISLGGMVAMEWMRQRREDLASCVLINSSASDLSPMYHRLRWQVWRETLRAATVQVARERERLILEVLLNSPEAREAALPQWTKIAIERPVSYLNFMSQLYAAWRFKGATVNSTVPVLLLSALGDRFVEPSCSTVLHEKQNWPIVRHPWAGHDLPWDDPSWVIDKIKEWNPYSNA